MLAMLAGIAHAGLHLAHADDAHFGSVADVQCQLASLEAGACAVPTTAPPLHWAAVSQTVPAARLGKPAPACAGTARGPPQA